MIYFIFFHFYKKFVRIRYNIKIKGKTVFETGLCASYKEWPKVEFAELQTKTIN